MSGQDWAPYVAIFLGVALVIWRLDRLGKKIEAVRDNLLLELGNAETQSEVLREREWEKKERMKEACQFWIFWAIVSLAGILWYFVSHR